MYGSLYRHVLLPFFDGVVKRRHTLEYWKQAEASQWWPRERLEAFQWDALQQLLRHAHETCPWYRDTWRRTGLNPASLSSWDNFHAWPVITRDTIRRHRVAMRTTLELPRLSKSTGGSSGEPVRFDLDHESNDLRTAMMYRGYGWAGGAPGSKQLYVWGSHVGNVPAWKRWKAELHHRFDRHLMLSCFDFTPQQMRQHLDRWNRYQPEVVIGYTNPLYEFARFVQRERLEVAAPRSMIVGAEKLHDFQRTLLQRVFRAPVFETYGSREFMLIGAECEHHTGLHLSLENLLVEILDDEGRPTPHGEEGHVVITDLFNYGMPFVRYANGDRALAGFDQCQCGRGLPLLKKVVGRQLDVLETPDGRKVPGEFFPHLLKEFPKVRRFQVVQTARETITLKLVTEGGLPAADRELLLSEVRKCTGSHVAIQLDLVDDIPLTRAGKHRVVVNAVPAASIQIDQPRPSRRDSSRTSPLMVATGGAQQLTMTNQATIEETTTDEPQTGAVTWSVAPIDAVVQSHLGEQYWDWRRLYDDDPHAAPLQHPDVVLSEVAHATPSHLRSILIAAERDSRCVGIGALLPKRITSNRLGGFGVDWEWDGLRLAGNDVLADPNSDAIEALAAAAVEEVQNGDAQFLLIEDLDAQSPFADALSRAVPRSWNWFRHAGLQPRRRIVLPASKADYWNSFSNKTLSTMRRKLKKFGETRLERITDVSQVARFLEVAHEISKQTWQSRQFGLRVRNDPAELEMLVALAQHRLLRSYLWFSNDEPVAFLIGNQDKGRFHYEEVGYATQFARYSPGQTMLVQVLDDLFEHDRPDWFDFGGGDADYKQFFANHESRSGTVWLFPPTARNRAAVAYLQTCRGLRRCARQLVVWGGWASRARQWVRYRGANSTTEKET